LRTLAADAERKTTNEERAEVYGKLLATCATCHAMIRDPMGSSSP
jgi:cytochrome c553